MKTISLSRNKVAIVDDSEYELLNQFKWYCSYWGYAVKGSRRNFIAMHKFILNTAREVDHINGNPLDNRKENLRTCTHRQNMQNTKPRISMNGVLCRSKYKGITWVANRSKNKNWRCRVKTPLKTYTRYFETELEAARMYDKLAKEHFKDFARLNGDIYD